LQHNNTALAELYFGYNDIEDEGARYLSEALRHNTVYHTNYTIYQNQTLDFCFLDAHTTRSSK